MSERTNFYASESRLVTPGPTPTPESVRLLMAKQLIHHRTAEFSEIFREAQEGLKWLFQTSETPLILTCSGTGGFEAALQTFSEPGDELIAIGGGKFGERWGEMGRSLHLNVIDVKVPWGRCVKAEELQKALETASQPKVVSVSVSETSTGVLHNLDEIIKVVRTYAPHALIGVDAVTALGVHDLPFDRLDIDFMVSGSQKALALPPGLAFVCASQRAWERAGQIASKGGFRRSYYFDLLKEKRKQEAFTTCFTPALTLVIGLKEVLTIFQNQGLHNLFQRHHELASFTRRELINLGFTLFAEEPSNAVTAAIVPPGISAPKLVKDLFSTYHVKIAGGQDSLKDQIIRIGHLGFIDYSDINYTLFAIKELLSKTSSSSA